MITTTSQLQTTTSLSLTQHRHSNLIYTMSPLAIRPPPPPSLLPSLPFPSLKPHHHTVKHTEARELRQPQTSNHRGYLGRCCHGRWVLSVLFIKHFLSLFRAYFASEKSLFTQRNHMDFVIIRIVTWKSSSALKKQPRKSTCTHR